MTMHTRQAIVCECGHTGFIHTRENDQPYSANWEKHSLEGFAGNTVGGEPYFKGDLLAALSPKCPACGRVNKVRIV